MVGSIFPSEHSVIRCLVTYTDWWQPATTSVLHASATRRGNGAGDGIRAGLVETLDQRAELCRRVWQLDERDRILLFFWYVEQLPVDEMSRALGISRRHCFRRRAKAIRALVDDSDEAA